MKLRHKRLAIVVTSVVGLTLAGLFVLNAFRSNLVFFYSPTEVLQGKAPVNQPLRIGGLVAEGSVKKDGTKVEFVVTDLSSKITVRYHGILPDLFREGQGVVAQGRVVAGDQFLADEVLAKHDENYMPPEVAAILGHPAKGKIAAPVAPEQSVVQSFPKSTTSHTPLHADAAITDQWPLTTYPQKLWITLCKIHRSRAARTGL
jgi:cytochrome c-type biogenesis protein CcmE